MSNEYHQLVPHHGCISWQSQKSSCDANTERGDKCNLSNYRPISVLLVFSKVLEKITYKQLYDYLEITRSYINNNMGFVLRSLLLDQAILHFLQYLYKHIDSSNVVFSLFLDFRKAFICLNNEILLSKLNTCGVQGITLIGLVPLISNKQRTIRMYKQCRLKP